MPFLVRKIDIGKWRQNKIKEGEAPSADAITICSKTSQNCLSTWIVETKEDISPAILAIVSQGSKIDTIDVAVLDTDKLSTLGLEYIESPGITPIPHLVNSHRDIVKLNYNKLGAFAQCIVDCFCEERIFRFTKTDLIRIFRDAISTNKIEASLLSEGILEALKLTDLKSSS